MVGVSAKAGSEASSLAAALRLVAASSSACSLRCASIFSRALASLANGSGQLLVPPHLLAAALPLRLPIRRALGVGHVLHVRRPPSSSPSGSPCPTWTSSTESLSARGLLRRHFQLAEGRPRRALSVTFGSMQAGVPAQDACAVNRLRGAMKRSLSGRIHGWGTPFTPFRPPSFRAKWVLPTWAAFFPPSFRPPHPAQVRQYLFAGTKADRMM